MTATRLSLFLVVVTSILLAARSATAQTYDLYTQFDTVNNPAATGGWSYGYEANPGASFQLLAFAYFDGNSHGWAVDASEYPDIENTLVGGNSITSAQAASGTEAPVIRWTAPNAGQYQINVSFSPFNYYSTSGDTTVSIRQSSQILLEQTLTGFSAPTTYDQVLSFRAGDTLDLVNGRTGTQTGKRVITGATIRALDIAPEPSSVTLLIPFFLGAVGSVARRRATK